MRYFIQVQNHSGIPFLFVMLFLSILSVFIGFFLRGFFSFWFQETASSMLLFIDWFLMASIVGFILSLAGVLSSAGYFLFQLRLMVKDRKKSDFGFPAENQYLDRPDQHSNS